ncbi:MAG TPA: RDD family protein [Methanocella sp.]|jgi:uncharacterized RDD family membrane protein YckC
MEFTEDARRDIEDWLKLVMRHTTLSKEDRAETEKELRSSLYLRAGAIAGERGSKVITREDVKRACAEERAPEEIAACFTKTYAGGLMRAGFLPRAISYCIDMVIVASTLIGIIIAMARLSPDFRNSLDSDFLTGLVPSLAMLAYALCYFILQEGYAGRTIGKYVLGLKVAKTDGMKIGYREAVLRNLTTAPGFPFFIIIDALMMLVFFREEKQRAFDRVAGTIVVSTRG